MEIRFSSKTRLFRPERFPKAVTVVMLLSERSRFSSVSRFERADTEEIALWLAFSSTRLLSPLTPVRPESRLLLTSR